MADLHVTPPKQRRSREAWNRVLDAGVAILAEEGYEAFTIAAVCDRAGVAPPAIYARTRSKDALFLAVYEHGIARLSADQAGLVAPDPGLPAAELVRAVVAAIVGVPLRHQEFLRPIVLLSASHDEVRRRGSGYSRSLGAAFVDLLAPAPSTDVEAWACFDTVFAAVILRIAYGPGFATPHPEDDDAFVARLGDLAVRYLIR
ncbi:TetR/AcrR family transcriptional regulator [Cryptosporangium japonicum]|uniref:HTH tetR-type domain-containing protein n=1 Tax=Cryptosporangium japonicum TaxID=80872 RepID=A0ABN0UDR6_9ACTN